MSTEAIATSSYENVAVIVPCYNEAQTIGKVVDDYARELPGATVYVYDNNSGDATARIAREMCEPILAGEADMTVGDRLSNGSYGEENKRAFHGFGNDLVRAMIRWIYGYAFQDVMTGYRAMSRPFVKTLPVLSEGFQIETELSIHAVDRRWRIVDVPIVYRDRPEGSVSKLDTVGDGIKVVCMIGMLFKDYRPLKFFTLVAALFALAGLVPRLPTVILAAALMFLCGLSLATGLILDSVAKVERKQWELQVYRETEKRGQ